MSSDIENDEREAANSSENEEEPEDSTSFTSIFEIESETETRGIESDSTLVLSPDSDLTKKSESNNKCSAIVEISDSSDQNDCILTSVEVKSPKKTIAKEVRRSCLKRKTITENIDLSEDDFECFEDIIVINDTNPKKSKPYSRQSSNSSTNSDVSSSLQSNQSTEPSDPGSLASQKSTSPVNDNNEPKTTPSQAAKCSTPEPLLPTLTDDMFVVEAPSFVIPYVYEKPPAVPFKNFVTKLGADLEEQRAKEEKEASEKLLAEKEKQKQERQEKRDKGEEVEQTDEELTPEELLKKQAVQSKRTDRRRKKKAEDDDDDMSWDGSSIEESDDDSLSGEDEFHDMLGDVQQNPSYPTDIQFESALGKFFIEIGTKLVQEHVKHDLLSLQNRKLKSADKASLSTKKINTAISQLTKNLETTLKANAVFKSELIKCPLCKFKSESSTALDFHLEMLHMRNNKYICRYCSTETATASDMLTHMYNVHKAKEGVEKPMPPDQCPNCPFEEYSKEKLSRHLMACNKKNKLDTNLAPPADWEFPAKTKPVASPPRPSTSKVVRPVYNPAYTSRVQPRFPMGNAMTSPTFRPRAQSAAPGIHGSPRHGITIRQAPAPQIMNASHTSIEPNSSIASPPHPVKPIKHNDFENPRAVIRCELCDGHVRDLEQLRNHFLWIHKHKIPRSVTSGKSRPPLDCPRCHFRFFTEQGLERHLLGAHGLVTKNLQAAANMKQDGGKCPVCGIESTQKMLEHVSRDHKLVLKSIDLSYKCILCGDTFDKYRQLENHINSAHIPRLYCREDKISPLEKAKPSDAAKD